jgi:Kef-type K+ transport system membrane component KefB
MNLVPHWRRVLKRAWSIRLMILAGLLSGVEVILGLPDIQLWLDWQPGIFAGLSFLATAAAFVARLLAQTGVSDANQQDHEK